MDVAALFAQAQREHLTGIDPSRLCRFALLPAWTADTAERFGLASPADLGTLLAQLDGAGLVDRRMTVDVHGATIEVFWLRAARRDEVGRFLRDAGIPVEKEIDRLAAIIGAVLGPAQAGEADRVLAAQLAPWLEVAGQLRHDHSGSRLYEWIDDLLDARTPGSLAGAARFVAAARALGAVSGGTLADAARRAGWRLDRAHRDALDAEFLRDYQSCADIEDALEQLIIGDTGGDGGGGGDGVGGGGGVGGGIGGGAVSGGRVPWALHLLGAGGIGKTMLLRYLGSGRYAEARGLPPFPVARVDFDQLDPRYPEHRPAEVLLALAHELTGYGRSRAWSSAYRRFRDAANALHEHLGRDSADTVPQMFGSALYPADGPIRSTAGVIRDAAASVIRGLFDEVVRAFARVLRELGRPRVVLVLDTCEELAKLYVPGAPAPAIDRTFDLLEQLHAELPSVRVVLAGRRPLVPPADPHARAAGPRLFPRRYLRVLPVRGFTTAEAESYLDAGLTTPRTATSRTATSRTDTSRTDISRTVASSTDADRTASPAVGPSPELRAALLDLARMPDRYRREERYNPFELAAYRDWIAREPGLDPEELRAAGDPLVERRIIQRLADDDARGALGVAVELGRFDEALITPALRRAGLDPRAAFDGLAAQEWIQVAALGPSGRPALLEIPAPLARRISAVISTEPARYPLDRPALGRDAAALVATGPLGQVRAEAVATAVRLLPPTEAVTFWADLEARVVATGEWAWAAQITTRAAAESATSDTGLPSSPTRTPTSGSTSSAEPGSGAPSGPRITAAILATQAAARIHTGHRADVHLLWTAVLEHAPRHPSPTLRRTLTTRARLGQLAALSATGDPANSVTAAEFLALLSDTALGDVPAGSLVGALEAIVDGPLDEPDLAALRTALAVPASVAPASVAPASVAPAAGALLHGLRAHDDPVIRLAAELAHAILLLRSTPEPPPASAPRLLAAIDAVERAAGGRPSAWADWVAPVGLVDRAHIAILLLPNRWTRRASPPDLAGPWLDDAVARSADVDAERRVATALRATLAHRVPDPDLLEHCQDRLGYVPGRIPTGWLRAQTRPLVIEIADGWALRNEPHRAAGMLRGYREAARAAGDDPGAVDACDLALLELCRRYRVTEFSPTIRQLARSGRPVVQAEAWLVLTLVEGVRPATPAQAGSWHAWWRCQDHRSLTEESTFTELPTPPRAAQPPWPALTAEVDRAEWQYLSGHPVAPPSPGGPPAPSVAAHRRVHLELRLRRAVLGDAVLEDAAAPDPAGGPRSAAGAVLDALPPLAAARLAVRVAEEMALRLPQVALALLGRSIGARAVPDCLQAAGDAFGAATAAVLHTRTRLRCALPPGAPLEAFPSSSIMLLTWPFWATRAPAESGPRWTGQARPPTELSAEVVPPPPWTRAGSAGGHRASDEAAGEQRPAPVILGAQPSTGGRVLRALGWWTAGLVFLQVAVAIVVGVGVLWPGGPWEDRLSPGLRWTVGSLAVLLALAGPAPTIAAAGRRYVLSTPYVGRCRVWRYRWLPRRRFGPYLVRPGYLVSSLLREHEVVGLPPADDILSMRVRPDETSTTQAQLAYLRWITATARLPRSRESLWEVRDGTIAARPRGRAGHARRRTAELRVVLLFTATGDRSGWERRLAADLPRDVARGLVFMRVHGTFLWASEARRLGGPVPFHGPRHLRPSGPDGDLLDVPGLAHAVGTPAATSSGLRLRVQDEGEGSAAGGGLLFGVEDLRVGDVALTVLQTDPVDGAAAGLGDDRAGFVDCAVAALDAGAQAVLVLPPLPDDLALAVAEAVRNVARAVDPNTTGGPASAQALPVLAARAAKGVIYAALDAAAAQPVAAGQPGAAGPDVRAGDDVLLFVR